MKIGSLIFVRGKGIIPSLIRFFDEGKFSHVAISLGNDKILETDYNTNVQIVQNKYTDYEIIELGLSQEQMDKIPQLAINAVGIHYDFYYILEIIKERFIKGNKKARWNNPKQMVCSELVIYILGNIGWLTFEEMNTIAELTPNELYVFIKNKLNKQ